MNDMRVASASFVVTFRDATGSEIVENFELDECFAKRLADAVSTKPLRMIPKEEAKPDVVAQCADALRAKHAAGYAWSTLANLIRRDKRWTWPGMTPNALSMTGQWRDRNGTPERMGFSSDNKLKAIMEIIADFPGRLGLAS